MKVATSHTSLSAWENGSPISEGKLEALGRLYGKSKSSLRYGNAQVHEEARDPFSPNPALRKRLRPKPYARVFEHIARMEAAECTTEQIEEAERLMIDGAYNKLNAKDPRERTDEEMILDIDDAWDWITDVLGREGKKGLK